MNDINIRYSILLVIAGIISTIVFVVSIRRKKVPGSIPLIVFSAGMMWWTLTYACHWAGVPRPNYFFWIDVTYLGVVIAPISFLAFSLSFTNQNQWFSRKWLIIASIEPILTLIFLWTDPWHGIFFAGKRMVGQPAILDGGVWFWFHAAYSYSLMFVGLYLLGREIIRQSGVYRLQVATVFLGGLIPLGASILALTDLNPVSDLDLTPFSFNFTAVLFAIGLYSFRLLDLVPLARSYLFENLPSGILVLGESERVVDINKAAKNLFHTNGRTLMGESIRTLLPAWDELKPTLLEPKEDDNEFSLLNWEDKIFDLRLALLHDHNDLLIGQLLLFYDITVQKNAQKRLQDLNDQLQDSLHEIEGLRSELQEQAIRDSLTGIYNRRYLDDSLPKEINRANREGNSLVAVIIDMDHFKTVNDRLGHKMGDEILRIFGQMITKNMRREDVMCRYGGDEFVVLFPGTTFPTVQARIEQFRIAFTNKMREILNPSVIVTLSIGVAQYPRHASEGEELLQKADEALYIAKNNGRNQMRVYGQPNCITPAVLQS